MTWDEAVEKLHVETMLGRATARLWIDAFRYSGHGFTPDTAFKAASDCMGYGVHPASMLALMDWPEVRELVPYDLEAPAKLLVPRMTPLRNSIPRGARRRRLRELRWGLFTVGAAVAALVAAVVWLELPSLLVAVVLLIGGIVVALLTASAVGALLRRGRPR